MISLNRNEHEMSNLAQPGVFSWRFYEKAYSVEKLGPQEWITLPDTGPVGVCISFPSGSGSAFLEGTCSPYDAVNPTDDAVNPLRPYSPVVYPICDTVTDITFFLVQGHSAIRINSLGGIVAISVRC